MITIYLDMDGVLAEFDERFLKYYGEFHSDSFEAFIADKQFETLEMMPMAKELLEVVDLREFFEPRNLRIEILSSLGGSKSMNEIAKQKTKWLRENNIHYPVNYTQHKGLKKNFSHNKAILLDDTNINVVEFSVNGFGILYKEENFDTIVTNLNYLVDNLIQEEYTGIYKVNRFEK